MASEIDAAQTAEPRPERLYLTIDDLPQMIVSNLSEFQLRGLVFASANCRVETSRVQTVPVSSRSSHSVLGGGATHPISTEWGLFLGGAKASSKTEHFHRTDVQFKLRDYSSRHYFVAREIPIAATYSIDAGDEIVVYFAKGGFNPPPADDCHFENWTPFAVFCPRTSQVVPLCPLPTLKPPKDYKSQIPAIILCLIGLVWLLGRGGLLIGTVAFSAVICLDIFRRRAWDTRLNQLRDELATMRSGATPVAEDVVAAGLSKRCRFCGSSAEPTWRDQQRPHDVCKQCFRSREGA